MRCSLKIINTKLYLLLSTFLSIEMFLLSACSSNISGSNNLPFVELSDPFGSVTSLAFSPDGQTLASGSWIERDDPKNSIKLWDIAQPKLAPRVLQGSAWAH